MWLRNVITFTSDNIKRLSLQYILLTDKTAVYAGISAEGNNSALLCWNFTSSGGATPRLQACTSAIVVCFRPGIQAN